MKHSNEKQQSNTAMTFSNEKQQPYNNETNNKTKEYKTTTLQQSYNNRSTIKNL